MTKKPIALTLPLALAAALACVAPRAATAEAAKPQDASLAAILAAQPADIQARYAARRPAETLAFCELEPGETVIETHPGGGWYSGMIFPYLGADGKLIGAHYPPSLFDRFGWDAERRQRVETRDATWAERITAKPVAQPGTVATYTITEMPRAYDATVDTVLFIRSLHNLARWDKDAGYLKSALAEAFRSLKPGGTACVVQHRAQENVADTAADGRRGYLKQSKVVAAFQAAGFELAGTSEMNANPEDRPSDAEIVWRLPPNFNGAPEGSDARATYTAIGESDRMTLKFVKPAQ